MINLDMHLATYKITAYFIIVYTLAAVVVAR